MAKAKKRGTSVKRSRSDSPKLVIIESHVDMLWKWGQRLCLMLIPTGFVLWAIFGWFNGVEALKLKVESLVTRVEAMWVGQTEIIKNIEKIAGKQEKKL